MQCCQALVVPTYEFNGTIVSKGWQSAKKAQIGYYGPKFFFIIRDFFCPEPNLTENIVRLQTLGKYLEILS